jgi:hypothetical protein
VACSKLRLQARLPSKRQAHRQPRQHQPQHPLPQLNRQANATYAKSHRKRWLFAFGPRPEGHFSRSALLFGDNNTPVAVA